MSNNRHTLCEFYDLAIAWPHILTMTVDMFLPVLEDSRVLDL